VSSAGDDVVLRLEGVSKVYSGTVAVREADFEIRRGAVNVLVGENGAGKSTLMKIIAGVEQPTTGRILLDGEPVVLRSSAEAARKGIGIVFQELNLFPNLSVAENIFAGRYPRRGLAQGYRIDWPAANHGAREVLARIGLDIDVERLLSSYPVAVQQLVAIARAISIESKVLILDEPTSSLDDDEVQKLFEVLRRLRSNGLAIVFVTHFLNQVYAVSDRITVLRNGAWVGEWRASELGTQALIAAMLGRELAAQSTAPALSPEFDEKAAPLLQAEGLGQTGQL
jgi:galactofuranose transport system ATP-binding protein